MRPRKFEEDAVLALAFDSFWRKGVRGTSIADIARDAGVQRGSLYNAYGSKEALFLKAYARYAADYTATISAALATGTLRDKLDRFFHVAIQNFAEGTPPRGCPTTRGLMELSAPGEHGLPEEARVVFAELLKQVEDELAAAFQAGVAAGEFGGDPRASAEHILAVVRGLVVIDSACQNPDKLHQIARHTIDLLLSAQTGA